MRNHGYSGTRTYSSWQSMRLRCNNPNATGYKDYGGRGITICGRWDTFTNFLADMGERPLGISLERIDNTKNYGPENCKWATKAEQQQNTRVTKLTRQDVENIRADPRRNCELAALYTVSRSHISRIRSHSKWFA